MVHGPVNQLTRTILSEVEKVKYYASSEDLPPNLAVHALRKSFKRLRALSWFYNYIPGGCAEKTRKDIRQFGRMLSPLRDSCVNTDLFDNGLSEINFVPERKKVTGEKLYLKNKTLIERKYRDGNIRGAIQLYFAGFESKLVKAGSGKVTGVHITRELSHSYLKSFSMYRELPGDISAEELHRFRKKLKRLYYQLDFIQLLLPEQFRQKTEQLDRINDRLGDELDLNLLIKELRFPEYVLSPEEISILETQTDHLRRLIRAELRPLTEEFFCELPEEFEQKLKSQKPV